MYLKAVDGFQILLTTTNTKHRHRTYWETFGKLVSSQLCGLFGLQGMIVFLMIVGEVSARPPD